MKNFYQAEEIFKDLSDNLKTKIFDIAAGKLVYFPKNHNKKRIINPDEVLIQYAQSKKSYRQIGDDLGVSKVRIFQIVKQERTNLSKGRVKYWEEQGLSLREIARLYKKSHEAVRRK
ncbi:MAG: hypothetical protein WBB37_07345 [bacterium]